MAIRDVDFYPRPWRVVGTPGGICIEDARRENVVPPNPAMTVVAAELICAMARDRDALLRAARTMGRIAEKIGDESPFSDHA